MGSGAGAKPAPKAGRPDEVGRPRGGGGDGAAYWVPGGATGGANGDAAAGAIGEPDGGAATGAAMGAAGGA